MSIEEKKDKLVTLAEKYLDNFSTDEIILAKEKCKSMDEFISLSPEDKRLMLGFFDIVIMKGLIRNYKNDFEASRKLGFESTSPKNAINQ